MIPSYDIEQSWRWNLQNSPDVVEVATHPTFNGGDWSWCGIPIASPLGVPAGPLLNSGWLLYYASMGFDVLVYKTVRSSPTECYALPNLVPVQSSALDHPGGCVPESPAMTGSWAVSFGMPSVSSDDWRRDVELARSLLPSGKIVVVSVVGTQDPTISNGEESLLQIADDFAACAEWAVSSGAHGVEANFSCPNVSTADGQLYQQPQAAALVAEKIRERIGSTPLVLKIGYVETKRHCEELVRSVAPFVSGFSMTNSIAARVTAQNGQLLFDGQSRGICGDAIRKASCDQVRMFDSVLSATGISLDIVGVGGISAAEHVRDYLDAGARSVGIATAAMTNPQVALDIREQWSSSH